MMSREGSQAIGERIPGLARDVSADSLSRQYINPPGLFPEISSVHDSIESDAVE